MIRARTWIVEAGDDTHPADRLHHHFADLFAGQHFVVQIPV